MCRLFVDIEWQISSGLVEYEVAVNAMVSRVDKIVQGSEREMVWLLEHPPVYTAGTSANSSDLLIDNLFPVIKTTRGGKYSYHGPGQRVVYVMLDLKRRNRCDIRAYVRDLGVWIVNTLAEFAIDSYFSSENIGVWVQNDMHSEKIAAFGIRLRRWVTYHGVAINISTDLTHYSGIVPCGILGSGVTSLRALGKEVTFEQFDSALKKEFYKVFA
ncbi:lipoyl(octanoyl) transferase LipB [Anaplasma phagocytophilum]|uniref:lipoyl(octanoyl) transferase LipB n=1 Tax=Anaplasma phagocytophilum TaxID=948 RepID=UPI003977C3F3